MKVSSQDKGDVAWLFLEGKYDLEGVNTARPLLSAFAEQKRGVVIDLSAVTFLISNAIRELVGAARALTRRGGRLVLYKPSATVEEVLVVAAVNSLIPIVRSPDEAQAVIAAALSE